MDDDHIQPLATMPRTTVDRLLRVRDCIDCNGRLSSRNVTGRCRSCACRFNLIHFAHPVSRLPEVRAKAVAAWTPEEWEKKRARLALGNLSQTTEMHRENARRVNASRSPEEKRRLAQLLKESNARLTPEERAAIYQRREESNRKRRAVNARPQP